MKKLLVLLAVVAMLLITVTAVLAEETTEEDGYVKLPGERIYMLFTNDGLLIVQHFYGEGAAMNESQCPQTMVFPDMQYIAAAPVMLMDGYFETGIPTIGFTPLLVEGIYIAKDQYESVADIMRERVPIIRGPQENGVNITAENVPLATMYSYESDMLFASQKVFDEEEAYSVGYILFKNGYVKDLYKGPADDGLSEMMLGFTESDTYNSVEVMKARTIDGWSRWLLNGTYIEGRLTYDEKVEQKREYLQAPSTVTSPGGVSELNPRWRIRAKTESWVTVDGLKRGYTNLWVSYKVNPVWDWLVEDISCYYSDAGAYDAQGITQATVTIIPKKGELFGSHNFPPSMVWRAFVAEATFVDQTVTDIVVSFFDPDELPDLGLVPWSNRTEPTPAPTPEPTPEPTKKPSDSPKPESSKKPCDSPKPTATPEPCDPCKKKECTTTTTTTTTTSTEFRLKVELSVELGTKTTTTTTTTTRKECIPTPCTKKQQPCGGGRDREVTIAY